MFHFRERVLKEIEDTFLLLQANSDNFDINLVTLLLKNEFKDVHVCCCNFCMIAFSS